MYKILDRQFTYREFADGAKFKTKEDIRQQLISYHSIDFENNTELPLSALEKMSLDEVLEYGEWEIIKA